jgi:GR25 family glycosyltransferase involved in LPS biosynthesis
LNNIEIYKYITENQIDHFLIIEDDTIFVDEFRTFFKKIFREIPRSYDFISLINVHIEEPHTQNKVGINTKINNKYLIHKSDNQYSHFNCILISKKGAKKILDFLYQHGIYYTVDCQIFDMSRRGILEGYSIRPDSRFVLGEIVDLGSIIDPENKRHNLADIKEKKIEK